MLRTTQAHVLGVEKLLSSSVFVEIWQPCKMIPFREVILGLIDLLSSILMGD
jgi:hypothetical protein